VTAPFAAYAAIAHAFETLRGDELVGGVQFLVGTLSGLASQADAAKLGALTNKAFDFFGGVEALRNRTTHLQMYFGALTDRANAWILNGRVKCGKTLLIVGGVSAGRRGGVGGGRFGAGGDVRMDFKGGGGRKIPPHPRRSVVSAKNRLVV
jgi:hypothetical protein